MKIEIYQCDRCGKQATTAEEKNALALADIILGFSCSYYSYSAPQIDSGHRQWNQQWCIHCRRELGIVKEELQKLNSQNLPPPITLEDMIKEIVACEVERITAQ